MEIMIKISKDIGLPTRDVEVIEEFISHNEWGLAFENLCSAIAEEGLALTISQFDIIQQLGKNMDMDPELWEQIVDLII